MRVIATERAIGVEKSKIHIALVKGTDPQTKNILTCEIFIDGENQQPLVLDPTDFQYEFI